jgi:hypothetical protein
MKTYTYPRKYARIFVFVILIIILGVSCSPLATLPASTPVLQTVIVTKVVTQEVTRIVEVPVTLTPTPSPVDTDTPMPTPTEVNSPTITPIPEPPAVTVLVHTQCLYGPDPAYISKYEILAASPQVVIGRNQDSSWLYVQGSDHKNPCWVKALVVKVDSGNLSDALVTDPILAPFSTTYLPPAAVSTNRAGNVVTIFWQPVTTTEADYNGYLIEAWVCQGGQLVFVPQAFVTSFDKNSSIMAVNVTDEPGCQEPSHARIYTSTKQAYSAWKSILWPAASTASLTPTP